jgi:hypothetical protein
VANQFSTTASGLTIDLSPAINFAGISGTGDVVNGYSGGGSTIFVADNASATDHNNGGTVNLAGNSNIIQSGNGYFTGVTVATVINGWNLTDKILSNGSTVAGSLYIGNSSAPVNGSSILFTGNYIEVNVGAVANDTATAMATAASAAYKVAENVSENVVFLGKTQVETLWCGTGEAMPPAYMRWLLRISMAPSNLSVSRQAHLLGPISIIDKNHRCDVPLRSESKRERRRSR